MNRTGHPFGENICPTFVNKTFVIAVLLTCHLNSVSPSFTIGHPFYSLCQGSLWKVNSGSRQCPIAEIPLTRLSVILHCTDIVSMNRPEAGCSLSVDVVLTGDGHRGMQLWDFPTSGATQSQVGRLIKLHVLSFNI